MGYLVVMLYSSQPSSIQKTSNYFFIHFELEKIIFQMYTLKKIAYVKE